MFRPIFPTNDLSRGDDGHCLYAVCWVSMIPGRAAQIPVEEAFEQDGRHIRPHILVRTMLEVMVNLYAASPSGSDFPLAAKQP